MGLSIREFMENRGDYTDDDDDVKVEGDLADAIQSLVEAWDSHVGRYGERGDDCTCKSECDDLDEDNDCPCEFHHDQCEFRYDIERYGYAGSSRNNNSFYVHVGPYVKAVIDAARR